MSPSIDVYAFSSDTVTNIWAGVGAGLWAVQKNPNPTVRGKAAKVRVPSFGILYAAKEKFLTVPFVILTEPDCSAIEKTVWHDEWSLPFKMKPLGTPRKRLPKAEAKGIIPSFLRLSTNHFGHVFRVGGAYAFNRCELQQDDWNILIERLAD